MQIDVSLIGLPRNLAPGTRVALGAMRTRGRPRARYRLCLRSTNEIEVARQSGIPIYLLTSELVTGLGYPVRFPPHLLVRSDVSAAIDCDFDRIVMSGKGAAFPPQFEDVVVALLRIDPLAARSIILRNRASVDPKQLLRRVVQEEVEREATWVNLQEMAPAIPEIGKGLASELLDIQDRAAQVVGLRA
jgi:hypothetical protein